MEDSGLIVTVIRRWRLVVLAVVVVTAGSLAADMLSPETYAVSARFMVNESIPELAGTPYAPTAGSQGWRTLYAPIRSDDVVGSALQAAGIEVNDIPEFINKNLNVVADNSTKLIDVSATIEGTEEQSLAFMTTLLELVDQRNTETFDQALDTRIAAGRAALEKAWQQVQVYDLAERYTEPVAGGQDAYGELSYELLLAEMARSADKELLVVMSEPYAEQESPSPLKSGVIGLALGLVAGLGVALIVDSLEKGRSKA